MGNDKLLASAKAANVDGSDLNSMQKHGLTESLAASAETKGLGLKDIFDLFMQFGPTFLTILNAILDKLKTPTQAAQPQKAKKDDKVE